MLLEVMSSPSAVADSGVEGLPKLGTTLELDKDVTRKYDQYTCYSKLFPELTSRVTSLLMV